VHIGETMKYRIMVMAFFISTNLFGSSFFEGNGPTLPHGAESSVTKKDFYSLFGKLEKLYKVEAKTAGKKLAISGRWSSKIVNAYAVQVIPGVMTVRVLGGIARHPLMTKDAFALVICHEVGHHFGGAPRKWERMNKWSSDEGQADYFATIQCLKRLWANDDNYQINESRLEKNESVNSLCSLNHIGRDHALCVRTLYASYDVSKLVASARHEDKIPGFDTPDPKIVTKTNQEHPGSQCRLDTMIAGAICSKNPEKFDPLDPNVGVCNVFAGDTIGNRPMCWYLPSM